MFRVGHGYDVHKLVEGRKLILGGVNIPHETGLLGHSDADVVVHAIMDAVLGGAGMDDIGTLFPDTDERFKDISSLALLKNVVDMIREKKYEIGNIDSTIIAEKPRLRAYIDKMKDNIANICNIEVENINIKATTEEGLGFTGSRDGIAAHAVVLIAKQGV